MRYNAPQTMITVAIIRSDIKIILDSDFPRAISNTSTPNIRAPEKMSTAPRKIDGKTQSMKGYM